MLLAQLVLACDDELIARGATTSGSLDATATHGAGGGGSVGVAAVGAGGAAGMTGTGGDTAGASGAGPTPEVPQLEFLPMDLPNAGGVTDFAFVPGSPEELLVLEHRGTVIHYRLEAASSLAEIGRASIGEVFFDEGCGLLSLTFDPAFEANRFLYISRCREQTVSTIARFELNSIQELPATEVEILSVQAPVAAEDWHRFGSIGFEPDAKTMWALVGDLFLRELAQDVSHKAGSLLRFLPNREPTGSGYEPASGNAFDADPTADKSIYAFGLRSPWRGTRDRFGRFWVGDVGLVGSEEVNLVLAPGQNFGWDRQEGPCGAECEGKRDPLTYYGRASDEPYVIDDPDTEPVVKRAVWVGQAYHAEQDRYYGLFDDAVMFGDFFTGWVRRLEVDQRGELISDELVAHLTEVTSWKTGPDGYMYVLTLPGRLHRAEQALE